MSAEDKGQSVNSKEEYRKKFQVTSSDGKVNDVATRRLRREALKNALDIMKFEIDLYWKRATYFWTLLAAAFAGYFALAAADDPRGNLIFLDSCIGLVLSTGWYLVNRGSKYWQENWERHVDALEDEFMGPLYKTTISNERFSWIRFWDRHPYSVSKVNQLISLFVVFIWFGLAGFHIPGYTLPSGIIEYRFMIAGGGTIAFILLLLCKGLSRPRGEPRRIDFRTSDLIGPNNK